MEMGGNFCPILELGGTTIKGRRVAGKIARGDAISEEHSIFRGLT